MLEAIGVFLNANWFYFFGFTCFIIFFWQFRKWNIEKLKQHSSNDRARLKDQDKIVDQDIQQYIANPEKTIEMLMSKRAIHEKSHDTKSIDGIDNQIKMLQVLAQIPAPVRPYAAKIGQSLMKKVSAAVDNFG